MTVHMAPSGTIDEVRERCEHRNPTLRRGADFLLYALLGSVALAALTATLLAYRNFFTPAHQLRDLPQTAG